ncbi:MAG: Kelch repeat-containing protein [Paludibacter sp.]
MHKTTILLLLLVFFAVTSCEKNESPYPDITFTHNTSFPGAKRATASGFVLQEKAYVLLGRNEFQPVKGLVDCWQYNPANSMWTQMADFPGIGRVGAIAEVVDGKAYVGFGYDPSMSVYSSDTTIFADFWAYDPQLDNWERKADFPRNAYTNKPYLNSCASFVYKKWVYIVGMSNNREYIKQVWRYNTLDNTWEQMNDFPGDARAAAVACTNGDQVFFGSGYLRYFKNDWWQYYPENDTWKKRASFQGGRVNAVAFSVNDRFFIATGRLIGGTLTDDYFYADVLEYDSSKDCWYNRGKLPSGGRENALALVLQNKVLLGLGETDNAVLSDFWIFQP